MPPLSGIDLLLWAAGLVGHAVLLAVLVIRHRVRAFPAFTALIAADVLRTVLLATLRRLGWDQAYLVVYVGAHIVDILLQFAVVYEIASHVFRPLGRWAPDTGRAMWLIVLGSIGVAGVLTSMGVPVQPNLRAAAIIRMSFFSSTLLSELFVGMVFLSITVGLPWRTHVARIAHGLGAYSLLDVAVEAVHTLHGEAYQNHRDLMWTYTRMVVYLACLGYWIVTLWRNAPATRELPPHMTKYLRELQTKLTYHLYTLRSRKDL